MIISASRRTDIPGFFSQWFMNRVRAGYCLVPHPYNRKKSTHVSLIPADVEAIVFWTKNPEPMLKNLDELDRLGFGYYFLYTFNDYPADLEPRLPPVKNRLASFEALASHLGPARVVWRYDPVILSNRTDAAFHRRAFRKLAQALAGKTERVITSLVWFYAKTRRRLGALAEAGWSFDPGGREAPEALELLAEMAEISRGLGIELKVCADERDLSPWGLLPARCVDGDLIARLWGGPARPGQDPGQRSACRCSPSKDIGVSDTCRHGCLYCYATVSDRAAERAAERRDPDSPSLI